MRKAVSLLCQKFPKEEKYSLNDQMKRSSHSVTANIAEGHGRFHYQENIQFCRQARGSLYELLDHFYVVWDEKYIKEETFEEFKTNIFNVVKILNGYIKFLRTKKD